jgi:predicted lipoprotein with Yx(FWY)xxD motif
MGHPSVDMAPRRADPRDTRACARSVQAVLAETVTSEGAKGLTDPGRDRLSDGWQAPRSCIVLTATLLVVGLGGCAGSDPAASPTGNPTSSAATTAATVTTGTTALGTVLTDSQGHTLYYLTTEQGGADQCSAQPGCSAMWRALPPPVGGMPSAGAAVAGSLGVIAAADGTLEVTYNGWPLHTFSNEVAGRVGGQGNMSFGGTWYVATAELVPTSAGAGSSRVSVPGIPTPLGSSTPFAGLPTSPFLPTTPEGMPAQPPIPTIPSGLPTNPY